MINNIFYIYLVTNSYNRADTNAYVLSPHSAMLRTSSGTWVVTICSASNQTRASWVPGNIIKLSILSGHDLSFLRVNQ